MAGGRDAYGYWLSTDTAHYMPGFCSKLGMAFTLARTGDPTPLPMRRQPQPTTVDPKSNSGRLDLPVAPSFETAPLHAIEPSHHADPAVTPRKLSFTSSPAGANAPTPPSPVRPPTAMNLGAGIATSPQRYAVQNMQTREVRTSIRQMREAREARARPETIFETNDEGDAPYTSFTGSPSGAWGNAPSEISAADMEASVAGLVYDSHADDITPGMSNLTNWINFSGAAYPAMPPN